MDRMGNDQRDTWSTSRSAPQDVPLLVLDGLPQLDSSAGRVAHVSEPPDPGLLDDLALGADASSP